MNKQDKTLGKALDIALSLNSVKPTLDRCVETGIQMAAWKEQQMIEKAISWISKNCIKYNEIVYLEDNNNVPTHIFHLENFIEDFKKYMEENQWTTKNYTRKPSQGQENYMTNILMENLPFGKLVKKSFQNSRSPMMRG